MKKKPLPIFEKLLDELYAAPGITVQQKLLAQIDELLEQNPRLKPVARLQLIKGTVAVAGGNNKEGLAFFEAAEKLADEENNIFMKAEALRLMGTQQHYAGRLHAAEESFIKARNLYATLGKPYNEAICLHALGITLNEKGEFEKCLEISEQALQLFKNCGLTEAEYAKAYIYAAIARISLLRRIKLDEKSGALLHEILACKELKHAGDMAHQWLRILQGQYYTDTGNLEKGNEFYTEFIENEKGNNMIADRIKVHGFLADNLIELKKYKEAEPHITEAVRYYRKNKDIHLASFLFVQARLFKGQKRQKELALVLKELKKIEAGMNSDFHFWRFNEDFSEYYGRLGDFEQAYKYLQVSNRYEIKCVRADYDKKIQSINQSNILAEQEKQNELLRKDIEMKKRELSMASDFLNQKIELLKELKGFMKTMRKENIQKNELMKTMSQKIDSVINVEREQQILMNKIETSANDFILKLRKKYPGLTATEAKICSLIRNNFSNKEIANLLVTSIRTVENHKYNIRKKTGIKDEVTFMLRLNNL